ncbi:MAG: 4Fe-4S dicluster domain-containing protein, partial [bacterium]
RLHANSTNCVGCLICQTICMQAHNGTFGINEARLRIESKPVEQEPPLNQVYVCTLCERCIKACEPNALFINEKGHIELKGDFCTSCKKCAEICPYDVIRFDENEFPVICDLCGGNPQCARWCKYDAILLR